MRNYPTTFVPKFRLAEPTGEPTEDVDIFSSEVERVLGEGGYSREAKCITEFAERVYSHFRLRGELMRPEVRMLFAHMANNPRKFIDIPRSDY